MTNNQIEKRKGNIMKTALSTIILSAMCSLIISSCGNIKDNNLASSVKDEPGMGAPGCLAVGGRMLTYTSTGETGGAIVDLYVCQFSDGGMIDSQSMQTWSYSHGTLASNATLYYNTRICYGRVFFAVKRDIGNRISLCYYDQDASFIEMDTLRNGSSELNRVLSTRY
jgi:hypothetical protein